jgi:hypothetical protein
MIEGVEGSQKWRAPHAQVVVDGKLGTLWVLVSDSLFRFRLENIPSLTGYHAAKFTENSLLST